MSAINPARTILIVEYEHELRVRLRRTLEDAGYSVISKTDTRGALTTLKEMAAIGMVLIDSALSGWRDFLMDMSKSLSLAAIPIVVLSEPGDLVTGSAVVAIVQKPVDLVLLLEKVKRYCQ